MNGLLHRILSSLKSFFAPIVEKGGKQLIVVSDGLASIVAVLPASRAFTVGHCARSFFGGPSPAVDDVRHSVVRLSYL